jgi:hypothetical protein
MNPLIGFLASTPGRITRIVAGLALIVIGLFVVGGSWGIVLVVIGAVPFLAGLFDFCVFAPLFGAPLSGRRIREA